MANLDNILITGIITATSNRQSDMYNTDPRKTAYLKVDKEEDRDKLVEFGLVEYTTKDTEEPFFIVKMSEEVSLYMRNKKSPISKLDTSSLSENFETIKPVGIAILKGKSNKGKNTYNRIYALKVDSQSDIVVREPQNPFEMLTEVDSEEPAF